MCRTFIVMVAVISTEQMMITSYNEWITLILQDPHIHIHSLQCSVQVRTRCSDGSFVCLDLPPRVDYSGQLKKNFGTIPFNNDSNITLHNSRTHLSGIKPPSETKQPWVNWVGRQTELLSSQNYGASLLEPPLPLCYLGVLISGEIIGLWADTSLCSSSSSSGSSSSRRVGVTVDQQPAIRCTGEKASMDFPSWRWLNPITLEAINP